MVPMPSRSAAMALNSPSRCREISTLARWLFLGLDERRHEMLAVPEREDHRHVRLDLLIDVGGLEAEAVGQPDQPQIFGRKHAERALNPAAAQQIAKQSFQRDGFVS